MRTDRRRFDRLRITLRRKLGNLETGLYRGFFGADGFDISGIRPYEPGDQLGRIHWQNTAFAGELMVWEAEPEIALRSGVVVDLSPSMFYGTDEGEKIDVASDVVAAVADVGSRNGNRVGALFAREKIESLSANQGYRHVARLLGLLDRERTPDGTSVAFVQALSQYNRRFKQRGLAVIVSDFLGYGWEDGLRRIARKHTVLAVRTIDRRELQLEDVGVITFEDPVSGEFVDVDTSDKQVREQYAEDGEQEREDIKQRILGSKAEYFELHTHGDWLEDFVHQLNRRNQSMRGRRVA